MGAKGAPGSMTPWLRGCWRVPWGSLRAGVWFLHTKTRLGAREAGRLPVLGLPPEYIFDFRDHSFLEVGGRVYDPTYAVAFPSWQSYVAHMVSCARSY